MSKNEKANRNQSGTNTTQRPPLGGCVGGVDGNTTPPAHTHPGKIPRNMGLNRDGRPFHPDEVEANTPSKGWTIKPADELTIDWITVTFRHKGILECLTDVRPLTPADRKTLANEPEENQYAEYGLKVSPVSAPFWQATYRWFEGATVSIGALGGEANEDKPEMVMLKMPGKCLQWVRQFTGMTETDLLLWLWQFIRPKSPPKEGVFHKTANPKGKKLHEMSKNERERGHFTRIDWAIDHLPELTGVDMITKVEKNLISGRFTSKWDRDNPNSQPKMTYRVQYGPKGKGNRKCETITVGNRSSETFLRVYDKRRELIAKGFKDPGHEWQRMELEKKGDQAHESAKAALDNIGSWRQRILGLFLGFTRFKEVEGYQKTRMDQMKDAQWYRKILRNAEYEPLTRPSAEQKPFCDYKYKTIEQTAKRLAKVLTTEALRGGESIQQFLKALMDRARTAMISDDWAQLERFFTGEGLPCESKDVFGALFENVGDQLYGQLKHS